MKGNGRYLGGKKSQNGAQQRCHKFGDADENIM